MKNTTQHKMIFILLLFLIPFLALAQQADEDEALYSDELDTEQTVQRTTGGIGRPQVIFSGSIDVRFVHTGEAISWKEGGRGLTRYGGIDTDRKEKRDDLGDQPTTAFKLPQITLVADILFNENVTGFLQFNYDDHFDSTRKNGRIGVVEAYIGYGRSLDEQQGVETRLGLVIPPISLEHPNTGWNTHYTITPSAINTWVGEELRMIAFEGNYHYNLSTLYSIDLMLAPFSGNDPAGSILTWRGWALHDYQLTTGSRLKTQTVVPEILVPRGEWVEPFKELDGRMGYYTKAGINRAEGWKAQVLYYDNMGDHVRKEYSTLEYAWRTKFTNISLEWTPFEGMTVLSQAMIGSTEMGARLAPVVEAGFSAGYLLLSYASSNHRFSARYDAFEVIEEDDVSSDPNDAEGTAVTAAYLYKYQEAHLFGAEFLMVDSNRPGVEQFDEDDDPKDDLFQLMYRITF